jgi:transposase-like protein
MTLPHHCHNDGTFQVRLTSREDKTDMDGATVSPTSQRDPRSQAVELYGTTDLSVAEIAAKAGVSKETVYRWLRKEGIAVGRAASSVAAGQPREHICSCSDDIKELRREISTLIGHVRRLEGLVEAQVGLRAQAV